MKYESIIFDLDGTLLDTLNDLMNGVNHILKKYGMPERTYEEIRSFVGNGVGKLVKESIQEGTSEEQFETMLAEFKEYYRANSKVLTKPYDGIIELLEEINKSGTPCAIVSNKVDNAVQDLTKIYFSGLIDIAIGERDNISRKPSPDMVNLAMRELGVTSGVYIGDSEVDVATAKNSKLDGIFVTWGFRDKETLEKAGGTTIVSTPKELLEALK